MRLEYDGVFKSWAVTRGPSLDPNQKRLAVEVEDHPLDYGDFEGTIPKGEYGGGTVSIWDRGYWLADGDVAAGLKRGEIKFALAGEKLNGAWTIVRLKNDRAKSGGNNWLLIKKRDQYAIDTKTKTSSTTASPSPRAAALKKSQTAAGGNPRPSSREANSPPTPCGTPARHRTPHPRPRPHENPRLARPLRKPLRGLSRIPAKPRRPFRNLSNRNCVRSLPTLRQVPEWLHEIKFDGYRIQMRVEDGTATLRTRKGLDWTKVFPEIAAEAARLARLPDRRRDRGAG